MTYVDERVRAWWERHRATELEALDDPAGFLRRRAVMIETRAAALMKRDGLDDGHATDQAFGELVALAEPVAEERWFDRETEHAAGAFVEAAFAYEAERRADIEP
ncbi:MAG: hypothetical protein QM679_05160 [Patulibacter sp.]